MRDERSFGGLRRVGWEVVKEKVWDETAINGMYASVVIMKLIWVETECHVFE